MTLQGVDTLRTDEKVKPINLAPLGGNVSVESHRGSAKRQAGGNY